MWVYGTNGKRRSEVEMIYAILKVCEGKKLTHIMYKANLNCAVLKVMLADLIKKGLIKELPRDRKGRQMVYVKTDKGIKALKDMEAALIVINGVINEGENKHAITML